MIVSDEIHFSIEDTYHGLRQKLTNDKYYFVFWFRLYHPFRWNTFVYRRSHRLRQQRQTTNMNLYHRSGYVIDSDEIHLSIEDVYHCLRQMRQMKNAIFSFKTHHRLWWSVLVYRRCVSLFSTNIVKWQMLFSHSEYIIDYDEIHLSTEDVYHRLWQQRQTTNTVFSFQIYHRLRWYTLVYRRCVSSFATNVNKRQMLYSCSEPPQPIDRAWLSLAGVPRRRRRRNNLPVPATNQTLLSGHLQALGHRHAKAAVLQHWASNQEPRCCQTTIDLQISVNAGRTKRKCTSDERKYENINHSFST